MNIDASFSGVALAAVYVPPGPEVLAQNRELIQAVRAINGSETLGDRNVLTFALDRETRRPVMRILDKETNELVSQIPPEAVLRMARHLKGLEE
ncbi:MAG: flagellar protein FlaG [Bryobacterales bacterium]|nr:flagellar protein FlaG [Bryobacterales bacterium]